MRGTERDRGDEGQRENEKARGNEPGKNPPIWLILFLLFCHYYLYCYIILNQNKWF